MTAPGVEPRAAGLQRPAFFTVDLGQKNTEMREFHSNGEVLAAWEEHNEVRLSPVTLNHYRYQVARFMEAWNVLVTRVTAQDLWNYLRAYSALCRHLTRRNRQYGRETISAAGPYCRQGLPEDGCGTKCPAYGALRLATVENHLNAVVTLYDYLVRCGAVPYNFVRDVKKEWVKDNKHRHRVGTKRVFTKAEVEALISSTRWLPRKVMYLMWAKTGIRFREMTMLVTDPKYYRPRDGWIEIPPFPNNAQDKRKGNRILIVDDQLLAYVLRHEKYMAAKLKRLGVETNRMFLNHHGQPWEHNDTVNRRVLRPDAVRAGIQAKDAKTGDLFATHSFRHFFSDHIEKEGLDKGVGDFWWDVLRGDTPKGNKGTYVHLRVEDIRSAYLKLAPQFEIPAP